MAVIRPFAAFRPAEELVQDVAALPYDVYNRKEAKAVVEKNPKTFLRIDRPETVHPDDFDMYSDEAYATAKRMLDEAMQDGTYVQEAAPAYYIYELVMDGRSQTGLVACASIDDYVNEVIKKHENTREEKEQDRIRHIDTCDAQTGPIFLAYREQEEISVIIRCIQQEEEPLYDWTAEDGVTHRVWVIDDASDIEALQKEFAALDQIYIADGHHRAASAVKVGLKRRKEHPDYNGTEEFNFFLSVLFPDSELAILPYNRVVKDWNGKSEQEFFEALAGLGNVEKSVDPAEIYECAIVSETHYCTLNDVADVKCIPDLIDLLLFLSYGPGYPVHLTDLVKDGSPYTKGCICLEFDILEVIKLIDGIYQSEDTVAAQILELHIITQVHG